MFSHRRPLPCTQRYDRSPPALYRSPPPDGGRARIAGPVAAGFPRLIGTHVEMQIDAARHGGGITSELFAGCVKLPAVLPPSSARRPR